MFGSSRFQSLPLHRPNPLVTSRFAVGLITIRVTLGGGGFHGLGEVAGQVTVEVHDLPDVVVELPDEAHVPRQAVGDPALMILIDLINEEPVLIEDVLHLHEALLERLQDLAVHLGSATIPHTGECIPLHCFSFSSSSLSFRSRGVKREAIRLVHPRR